MLLLKQWDQTPREENKCNDIFGRDEENLQAMLQIPAYTKILQNSNRFIRKIQN